MGAYLLEDDGEHPSSDVDLHFATAYDSDERQVQQIDSLVATGIDLLIVAPNQVQTISQAIDRAFDKGIPVIVFERKTNSQKYTAFISADNYEMGRVMGEHIASQLHGTGRVVEIMGLKGSSPAIERHNGFADALKAYPGIEIVATLQGDWTEESAYKAVSNWLERGKRKEEREMLKASTTSSLKTTAWPWAPAGLFPLSTPHFPQNSVASTVCLAKRVASAWCATPFWMLRISTPPTATRLSR